MKTSAKGKRKRKHEPIPPPQPGRAPVTPSRFVRLLEAAFFIVVGVFAVQYLGPTGSYRHMLRASGQYVRNVWGAFQYVHSPATAAESFTLDLRSPRELPGEFGGGPILTKGGETRVAVTAPALRLVIPRLQSRDEYEVRVVLSARLPAPQQLGLQLGDDLHAERGVAGSGDRETITWRVPGGILAACDQPLLLRTSWDPTERVSSGAGEQAVWWYLRALSVTPVKDRHAT